MDTEINIPKDDPVRLFSAIIERMNLEALFATCCENGRIEYDSRCLLKICIYGYARHIISSRHLATCQEQIQQGLVRVLIELGEVDIKVPRDRNGSFEPKIIGKYDRNADGM